jgi:hypothetical protein
MVGTIVGADVGFDVATGTAVWQAEIRIAKATNKMSDFISG